LNTLFCSASFAVFANHAKWIIVAGSCQSFAQKSNTDACLNNITIIFGIIITNIQETTIRAWEGFGCVQHFVLRKYVFCIQSFLCPTSTFQILSNNIHPRVIFCSDGRGGDALGGGAWSDKVDLGDVKLTRSTSPAALSQSPSCFHFGPTLLTQIVDGINLSFSSRCLVV
jgi:hypothetical protein